MSTGWLIFSTLLFSAFLGGVEIAFLSSSKLKVEIDKQQGKIYSHLVNIFMRHQGQFTTSIVVANTVALVIYAIAMADALYAHGVTSGFSQRAQLTVSVLISSFVILVAGDFLPKTICRLRPNFFLRAFSIPAFLVYLLCYPVAKLATWLSVAVRRYIFREKAAEQATVPMFEKNELQNLTGGSTEAAEEPEREHDIQIFRNALEFADVKVRDCMVPRTEIEAIALEESVDTLRALFVQTGFSRILVYRDSIDSIIGYVKSTDLFKSYANIRDMLITPEFVPESMSAQKLLATLIKTHRSIAVVVDEFGGTAGMVTLEDVMEEIFGEIEDEHDSESLLEKKLSDNEFVFAGRLEVAYLNEKYHLHIKESDEYETLAGFIIFSSESIPNVGEVLELDNFKVRILKTTASKIDLVHVALKSKDAAPHPE
ncbi:MAG: hemolysin family protein [Prevotellaceae bacterium]|jgi:CBS domain containing-hemolysin-like protein|nr:hemolysin family protein [Prevotellaceae bacterium]